MLLGRCLRRVAAPATFRQTLPAAPNWTGIASINATAVPTRQRHYFTYFRDDPIHTPVWSLRQGQFAILLLCSRVCTTCADMAHSPCRCLYSGGVAGVQALDPYVFDCQPRADILHRVVVWQLARRRAGTAKTKGRAEVCARCSILCVGVSGCPLSSVHQ